MCSSISLPVFLRLWLVLPWFLLYVYAVLFVGPYSSCWLNLSCDVYDLKMALSVLLMFLISNSVLSDFTVDSCLFIFAWNSFSHHFKILFKSSLTYSCYNDNDIIFILSFSFIFCFTLSLPLFFTLAIFCAYQIYSHLINRIEFLFDLLNHCMKYRYCFLFMANKLKWR